MKYLVFIVSIFILSNIVYASNSILSPANGDVVWLNTARTTTNTFSSLASDDTNRWSIGTTTNAAISNGYMRVGYSLSGTGISRSQVLNMTFYLLYCFSTSTSCSGSAPTGSTINDGQNIKIYDFTTDSLTPISNLTAPGTGSESSNITIITGTMTDYINSTGNITILYEMNYTTAGGGNDAFLVLDYAFANITYDNTAPTVTINMVNNTNTSDTTPEINFTITDDIATNLTYQIYIDGSASISGNAANNTLTFVNLSALGNGTHTVRIEGNDTVNNKANSTLITFKVDDTKSRITLNSPANDSVVLANTVLLNFTTQDNVFSSIACSLNINGIFNQSNSAAQNGTTAFNITIAHGFYNWSVNCTDPAGNANSTSNFTFFVNRTPVLQSISVDQSRIKGGDVITVSSSGANDPNNDTLNFYCSFGTPNSTNTICTGGTTVDTTPPYSLSCTFATTANNSNYTVFCRTYDSETYSSIVNATYETDVAAPVTTINNVAGDATQPYYDITSDGTSNITIDGEANMTCRWSTSDLAYGSMSNSCNTTGTQASCPATTVTQGLYTFYVACADSLGNAQNSTQNLDVTGITLDYTAPTTTDNASSSIQLVGYNVTITESDNVDPDPTTLYCVDTTNTCVPATTIDHLGKVTFTTRGTSYLRYNSTDYVGNSQATVNKTILINVLPTIASASDNTVTIKGGNTINITTVSTSSDAGQMEKLFVCKTNSANFSGCSNSTNTYCSANATNENATCAFSSEIVDDTYIWYAFIFDEINESAVSNPRTGSYTVDAAGPEITIISPTNTTYTTENLTAQISLSEAGDNATYCLDACASNISMARVSSTFWTGALNTLSSGQHYIVFYANDTYGNLDNSSTLYFTVNLTFQNDTTQPSITVISPTNASYINTATFTVNVSINENASWAGYSLNNGDQQIMENASLTIWNTTLNASGEAQYNITIFANDTSNNQGNTSFIVYIDRIAPLYASATAIPNPANQSQNVLCSVLWTDGFNITSVKIEENASGVFENHTISFSGISNYANYTIVASRLSIGNYTCNFYATDIAGNTNSTSISFVVQDVVSPVITIISPENTTYSQSDVDFQILSNEALKRAYYCLDSCASNVTMSNASTTFWFSSVSVSEGFHTLTFYANDTSNNVGTASINFTANLTIADTTLPTITVRSPTNASYFTTTSILFNISTSENATSANFSLDDAAQVVLDNYTNRNWNATVSVSGGEVQHNLTFFANDTSNNQGNTSVVFYVDQLAPRYSLATAIPNPANQSQNVLCSVLWTDGFNITSVKIEENSSGSFVNHTIDFSGTSGYANYTILNQLLTIGNYTCNFYATDTVGNTNSTSISFVVQDVTSPLITITSPLNSTYNSNSIVLQIVTSENLTSANFSLDDTANISLSGSGILWNATMSVSDGSHTVTVFAFDPSSNFGSASRSFSVDASVLDSTPPIITALSPLNNTYYNYSNILFNITTNENIVWSGYSLNSSALIILDNASRTNWNTTAALADGVYEILFKANDSASNQGNSTLVSFFVDTTNPQNSTLGFLPSSPNDTSEITCFSSFTDNIALSYGFVEYNSTGSLVNSSNISLLTIGNLNFTFNASNSVSIAGCKFYAFDKAGNLNKTNMFSVSLSDATNPLFENITYLPNTTADLDPSIQVNVSVNASDNRAISFAVLQYRLRNESIYQNTTMTNIAGTGYNASFMPVSGNWTFRINITDTNNNSNLSNQYNLSIFSDDTWVNTTTIPAIKSILLSSESDNNSLGNLTINNTGDSDFNFTITITSTGSRITLNSTFNATQTINLLSSQLITITVEANTTGLPVGLYNYSIFIQATRNGSVVSNSNLSLQLNIQNVPTPLLSVTIDTFSSSVVASQSDITYSAVVQNLGTSDATGVWLAWTLPAEFTLTSGTLNRSIGNLAVGSTARNTIVISVSSADNKTTSINASSNSNEGTSDSESKTVTIGQPTVTTQTVTQTTTVSTGGGGGGSSPGQIVSAALQKKDEIAISSETIDIVRGQKLSFPVIVKNIYPGTTLYNISIKLSGYLSQYMNVVPTLITNIKYKDQNQFIVTISSPEYLENNEYKITVVITGDIIGSDVNKRLVETRAVTLTVHEISREEALSLASEAENIIKQMQSTDLYTSGVSRLLVEANVDIENHNYDSAKVKLDEVKRIKETAFSAKSMIERVQRGISNYEQVSGLFGVKKDAVQTKNIMNLAIAAMERGDFSTALQRAKDAELTLAVESNEFHLILFLMENWLYILIGIAFLYVASKFGYKLFLVSTITQRIKNLKKEEITLIKMAKKSQKSHFLSKKFGPITFEKQRTDYNKRLSEIRRDLTKLLHAKAKVIRPEKVLNEIDAERKEIMSSLTKLQNDYFVERKISKDYYTEQHSIYESRLAEIEDEELTSKSMMKESHQKYDFTREKKWVPKRSILDRILRKAKK